MPGTLVQIRSHLDAVRDVRCSTNAKCHRVLGVTLFVRTYWYLIGEIVEAQNCGGSYEQGKRDEARELLAPVYGWFTEG